jgi:hypothetical protein
MQTSSIGPDPLGYLLCGQHTGGFRDGAFPVDPLRRDGVQPRALTRQPARDDTHALPGVFDVVVMRTEPWAHQLAFVPRSVVPHQQQGALPPCGQTVAAPRQTLQRPRAYWLTRRKPQPKLLRRRRSGPQQQPIARQGLGLGIGVGPLFFDQTPRGRSRSPALHVRLRQAPPPHGIGEAQQPLRVAGSQADQPVARLFFRVYAGSGLVIQCLARFQRVLSRARAVRTVAPLTRRGRIPVASATAAARSSVQTLVGLLKPRGLWCSNACNCSHRVGVKTACGV